MPLNIVDFPAAPECNGKQWSPSDENLLATLVAMVLIGRAQHAERVIRGALRRVVAVPEALSQQLHSELFPKPGANTHHRDGLLFEIIAWIVARMTAAPSDLISTPHLKSTQQGLDTLKVSFDPVTKDFVCAVVHEQKCTEYARNKFRDEVKRGTRMKVKLHSKLKSLEALGKYLGIFARANASKTMRAASAQSTPGEDAAAKIRALVKRS
jgi:hypothetical protein